MRMTGYINWHAIHKRGKVSAMIQIEATQEILVGLTIATVLGHNQAWYRFQYLGRP